MTSKKLPKIYEDDLYYPVYIRGRYTELSGKKIKELEAATEITLTIGEYQDILDRLDKLEGK